jgi:hypothetical protein
MKDLARNALDRANELVSAAALKAVRPIYRNVGTRPEHLGTVSFVEVDEIDYILTAAHVLDDHETHTLYIGHTRLQDITLTFRSTSAPGGDRLNDHWDFAFAKADSAWREQGIVPLAIGHPVIEEAAIFTAVGYPNSANRKVDVQKRQIRPTQRRFSSTRLGADHPIYEDLGIAFDTHAAISRDPKYAISNGKRVKTFEPRGMSGGIIFGLSNVHSASVVVFGDEPVIFPAGLITDRSDRHRALFGPALTVIADQIRAQSDGEH